MAASGTQLSSANYHAEQCSQSLIAAYWDDARVDFHRQNAIRSLSAAAYALGFRLIEDEQADESKAENAQAE